MKNPAPVAAWDTLVNLGAEARSFPQSVMAKHCDTIFKPRPANLGLNFSSTQATSLGHRSSPGQLFKHTVMETSTSS